jgi:hypothetical protein
LPQRLKETQRRTFYPKRKQKRRKGFASFSPFNIFTPSCFFALPLPASLPYLFLSLCLLTSIDYRLWTVDALILPAIFATKAQRLKETQRRTFYPKREQKSRKDLHLFRLFIFLDLPAFLPSASLPHIFLPYAFLPLCLLKCIIQPFNIFC